MSWDPTQVYVAACGIAFPTWRQGKAHEEYCPECREELGYDERDDWEGDDE